MTPQSDFYSRVTCQFTVRGSAVGSQPKSPSPVWAEALQNRADRMSKTRLNLFCCKHFGAE
jgi:hypothetical protein